MRIISTAHKMTSVSGSRVHLNGFGEADFQAVVNEVVSHAVHGVYFVKSFRIRWFSIISALYF